MECISPLNIGPPKTPGHQFSAPQARFSPAEEEEMVPSYEESQALSQTSQYSVPDVHTITRAMPVSYWCGRYSALSDKARTADPMEPDENRLERVLFEMELWCSSPEALDSLQLFKNGLRAQFESGTKKAMEKRSKEKVVNPPSGKENVPPVGLRRKKFKSTEQLSSAKLKSPAKHRTPLAPLPLEPGGLATPLPPSPLLTSKSMTSLAGDAYITPENRSGKSLPKAYSSPGQKVRKFSVFPKVPGASQNITSVSTLELKKLREFDKLEKMGLPPMLRLREAIASYDPNKITPIRNIKSPEQVDNRRASVSFSDQRFDPLQNQRNSLLAVDIGPWDSVSVRAKEGTCSEQRSLSEIENQKPAAPPKQPTPPSTPVQKASPVLKPMGPEPNIKESPIKKKQPTVQPRQTKTSLLRANRSRKGSTENKNPFNPSTPKRDRIKVRTSDSNFASPKNSQPLVLKSIITSPREQLAKGPRLLQALKAVGSTSEPSKKSTAPPRISRESLKDIGSYLNADDDENRAHGMKKQLPAIGAKRGLNIHKKLPSIPHENYHKRESGTAVLQKVLTSFEDVEKHPEPKSATGVQKKIPLGESQQQQQVLQDVNFNLLPEVQNSDPLLGEPRSLSKEILQFTDDDEDVDSSFDDSWPSSYFEDESPTASRVADGDSAVSTATSTPPRRLLPAHFEVYEDKDTTSNMNMASYSPSKGRSVTTMRSAGTSRRSLDGKTETQTSLHGTVPVRPSPGGPSKKVGNAPVSDENTPPTTERRIPLNLPRLVQNQRLLNQRVNRNVMGETLEMPETGKLSPIAIAMSFLTAARECEEGPMKEQYFTTGTTLIENISKSSELEKKYEEIKLELSQTEFEMVLQRHRVFKMAMAIKIWQDGKGRGPPPDLAALDLSLGSHGTAMETYSRF